MVSSNLSFFFLEMAYETVILGNANIDAAKFEALEDAAVHIWPLISLQITFSGFFMFVIQSHLVGISFTVVAHGPGAFHRELLSSRNIQLLHNNPESRIRNFSQVNLMYRFN